MTMMNLQKPNKTKKKVVENIKKKLVHNSLLKENKFSHSACTCLRTYP